MRFTLIGIVATTITFLSFAPASAAQGAVTVEQVRNAIENGKAYLRREQQRNGAWSVESIADAAYPGGAVSLALLAMLTCGVTPDDQSALKQGLDYMRTFRPKMEGKGRIAVGDASKTYAVSLQTMVFALAGHAADKARIQENVDWLLAARIKNDDVKLSGWGYGGHDGSYDASNTQYALLALHEAVRAGAKVDRSVMEDIQKFYLENQNKDGGWAYKPGYGSSMTMTTAGVCGQLITGMDVEAGRQILRADGSAEKCGVYADNEPVAKGLKWIGDRFPASVQTVEQAGRKFSMSSQGERSLSAPFYGFYGIERTGRLTGQRFLQGHDWYRVGCQFLVNTQHADGSWAGNGIDIDGNPIVATCFALLFLGKGRTPVLMTKLAYGDGDYLGWNNKHNDMRNVVEFAGRELFKKQPMAWQVFDIRQREAGNPEAIRALTQELLESPIVFFNGHDFAPRDKEKDLLKEYLANGGFVFAERCCGPQSYSAGFDKDFRALMHELYPDADLKPLDPLHPIFTASGKYVSSPADFPLEGIQQGCKTLVVYCPTAISGYWEANDVKSDKGRKAFEMAANVIAYATGLEPPRQKLDSVEIVEEAKAPVKRGYFKAAQLMHNGEWQPAPKAMHNLMVEANKVGLDVALEPKAIYPSDANVINYRFLYMHGRGAFSYKASQLEHLRFDLEENGALLFADACCGSKPFDESFRKFMDELWVDHKDKPKLEPIPPDDELYSADLNGKKIDYVMCRRESPDGKGIDTEFRKVKPALEGIKLNGRWVVIYSRYDIGCALERHPTPGCLGHDYASAVALGKAAVLYALKR
jgi:Domain of unknown function (DUF4159)/Prenyltransferase and squalene oxidase repeat